MASVMAGELWPTRLATFATSKPDSMSRVTTVCRMPWRCSAGNLSSPSAARAQVTRRVNISDTDCGLRGRLQSRSNGNTHAPGFTALMSRLASSRRHCFSTFTADGDRVSDRASPFFGGLVARGSGSSRSSVRRMCSFPMQIRFLEKVCSRWVAAKPRELCGPAGRDMIMRNGPRLGDYLMSPATAALTGERRTASVLPLRTATGVGSVRPLPPLLEVMRLGGVPGTELSADVDLPASYQIGEMSRDALAVLSAAPVEDLPSEVEVTVNVAVPEWKGLTALVKGVSESCAITVTAPLLSWPDHDIVVGELYRISLRARVRRGVVCESGQNTAILLTAGTTFSVLGIDSSPAGHVTIYAVQAA